MKANSSTIWNKALENCHFRMVTFMKVNFIKDQFTEKAFIRGRVVFNMKDNLLMVKFPTNKFSRRII